MEKLVNNTIKFSITHDSSVLPQAHFNEKIVIKDNIESKDAVTQHNLIHPELRDLLDKYNILNSSNFNERVGTLRKILSNNDFSVFNKLKGIKVADILEGNGGHSIEELPNAESRKIFEQLMKEFPPNSTSKGETMGRWTFEIVKNFEQLLTKNN